MSLSAYAVPAIVGVIILYALVRKCEVYSSFTSGATDGLRTALSIAPQLVGLLVAIKMFSTSGAMDSIVKLIAPVAEFLHIPTEVVPFALLRPVSGSGSLAMATDIFAKYGADSFAGRVASVMMGSTETTFYVSAVYFGAVGVKNTRHALTCALCADALSLALSIIVCTLVF